MSDKASGNMKVWVSMSTAGSANPARPSRFPASCPREKELKLPCSEAGPPNHLNNKVDAQL